jgi:hypothetical protein
MALADSTPGLYWKGVPALIVSHVMDESASFVPKWVRTPADFTSYVSAFVPEHDLGNVRAAIERRYPAQGPPYRGDQQKRVSDVIRDSTFTCNTRYLYNAYNATAAAYMMQYSFLGLFGAAKHASDLLPTFWHRGFDVSTFLARYMCLARPVAAVAEALIDSMAPGYQEYLASFAVFGHPNHGAGTGGDDDDDDRRPEWRPARVSADGERLQRVLNVQLAPFFDNDFTDTINTHATCEFWLEMAYNVSRLIRWQRQHPALAALPSRAAAADGDDEEANDGAPDVHFHAQEL